MKVRLVNLIYPIDYATLSQKRHWNFDFPRHLAREVQEGKRVRGAFIYYERTAALPGRPTWVFMINLFLFAIVFERNIREMAARQEYKAIMEQRKVEKARMKKRGRVELGAEIGKTTQKRHAWFESSCGRVRKPIV